MSGIVFEDPPPSRRTSDLRIVDRLKPLRERPGQWARVLGPVKRQNASNFAGTISHGRAADIEAGEYEATVRLLDDGAYVWARYVGNGAS